jgi:LysR family transcriptional activator of nhaA
VAQPTISAQLRALERDLGQRLFTRSGRNLVLTDTGRTVHHYADGIFTLGRELMETLDGHEHPGARRFNVGVVDVIPKLIAREILRPVMEIEEPVHMVCYEGKSTDLLTRLAAHELDLVVADAPVNPEVKVKAFNHVLGESGISIFGTDTDTRGEDFPRSLDGAPFFLPTTNTTLRRSLDTWFEANDIHPRVIGEFEDSALMKVFGQLGGGHFAAPTVIENHVSRHYGATVLGRTTDVVERFYAISIERRVKHPAVQRITESARRDLFGNGSS